MKHLYKEFFIDEVYVEDLDRKIMGAVVVPKLSDNALFFRHNIQDILDFHMS